MEWMGLETGRKMAQSLAIGRDFEHNATLERRSSKYLSLVGSPRQHSSPKSTHRVQVTLSESADCCVLFMRSTSIIATGTYLVRDAWCFSVHTRYIKAAGISMFTLRQSI